MTETLCGCCLGRGWIIVDGEEAECPECRGTGVLPDDIAE